MNKLNICFREVKSGKFKGSIDCVFLDFATRKLRLECYAHIGQHSEGCIRYFYNSTKPAKNYSDLLNEIKSIYSDYEIIIHNKLPKYETILERCYAA